MAKIVFSKLGNSALGLSFSKEIFTGTGFFEDEKTKDLYQYRLWQLLNKIIESNTKYKNCLLQNFILKSPN